MSDKVTSGQRFTPKANTWNSFVDAANYVANQQRGQCTPGGKLTSDAIKVRNTSGHDAPQYGIGRISSAAFKELPTISRAQFPGFSDIAVFAEPVANGSIGKAWTNGVRPVRMTSSGYSSIAVKGRIGLKADSFEAMPDQLGPLTVVAKLEAPIVLAQITGQRGDHKIVDCDAIDASLSGPYQTIIWGNDFTGSSTSPGTVNIALI